MTARSDISRDEITPETIRELYDCDYETCQLTYRLRARKWFKSDQAQKRFNTLFAGKQAFTSLDDDGYLSGFIFTHRFKFHRVIWAHRFGEWPKKTRGYVSGVREAVRTGNLQPIL